MENLDFALIVTIAGVVAAIISVVVAVIALTFMLIFDFNKSLETSENRALVLKKLESDNWHDYYRQSMAGISLRLHRVFGATNSFKAFVVTLALALIYPIIFFFIGWGIANESSIQGINLLPSIDNVYLRVAVAVVMFSVVLFILSKFSVAVAGVAVAGAAVAAIAAGATVGGAVAAVVVVAFVVTVNVAAFFAASVVAVDAIGAAVVTGAVAAVVTGTSVLVARVAVVAGVAGVVTGAAVLVGKVAVNAGVVNVEKYAIFLLFFTILPLLNGVFDSISWSWSRYFIERSRVESKVSIMRNLMFDLFIALILLLLLCASFPLLIDVFNLSILKESAIDWRSFLDRAVSDPWSSGLFVTLMVITTFIPTCIHILAAVVALWVKHNKQELISYIQERAVDNDLRIYITIKRMIHIWRHSTLALILPIVLLPVTIISLYHYLDLPIAKLLLQFINYTYEEPNVRWVLLAVFTLLVGGMWVFKVETVEKARIVLK